MRVHRRKPANRHIKLALFMTFISALSRLLPHFPNVTPLTNFCFLAGSKLSRFMAYIMLFFSLFLSDLLLAYFHGHAVFGFWSFFNYTGFGLLVFIGSKLNLSVFMKPRIFAYIFIASLGFWTWTNFGVWLASGLYPRTLNGLSICYMLALPFLRNALLGDLLWCAVIQYSARVAELADALDLGSSGATCESSSLSSRTRF
jgi:hypothetical protein